MLTARTIIRGILAVGVLGFVSAQASAAEEYDDQVHIRISDPEAQLSGGQADLSDRSVLRRASQLIGEEVKSPQGRRLGTIYDLVLTEDHDSISYLALSRGGVLGLGRSLYAIPWSAISIGVDDTYIAPISEEQLRQTHGFRHAYWPATPVRGWLPEDEARDMTYRGATREESREVQNRRVSRILGTMVRDQEGKDVADIEDLVVKFDTGRIAYFVTSFGGFFGLGEQYAVVPPAAITLQPEREVARLSVSGQTLQANAFAPNQFPDLGDPAYAQRVNRMYGQGPDWVVLGYVAPAEEPAEHPVTGEVHLRDVTTDMVEPEQGRYSTVFDPASLRTIEGTVLDMGKLTRGEADFEGLWLRLRTDPGDIVTVYAGPRDYVAKQDFYIISGDRVSVTGATARAGTHSVFLATQITSDGHVLQLRNRNGEPLWEQRDGEAERAEPEMDDIDTETDVEAEADTEISAS